MAPPAGKISKQEWERYDDIIHDLYHVRGLPLQSEKGPSVLQIMRDEHHFSASELSAVNIEARVKLSGHVLSKTRIKRSQRYAFPGLEQPRHDASDGFSLPPARRVTIEIRGADGEWSAYEYTGGNTVADSHPSLPADDRAVLGSEEPFAPAPALVTTSEYKAPFRDSFAVSPHLLPRATNDHVIRGLEGSSSLDLVQAHGNRAFIPRNQESPLFSSPSSPWNDAIFLDGFGPSLEIDYPWSFDPGASQLSGPSPAAFPNPSAYETPFTPWHWAGESSFFQLLAAVSAEPGRDIRSRHKSPEHIGAGHEWDSPLNIKPRISPNILVQSLLDDAAQVLIDNSMSDEVLKLPDPDEVMDSLLSLLPESRAQDGSWQTAGLATRDVIFDSPFYSALLFSIANGFAGLRNIPSGAILRMLRKQHQVSSRFFNCLRSCPPVLAKPLADNLFRAAVEACDKQAVITILQATRNSPSAIDPNEIVCELDRKGRLYTPIELAAKFRHLGIVQTLLAANADINKTHEKDEIHERGALELAVRKWGIYEAVDMELVRTLLDCHAEVRVALVSAVIRWGQTDLLRELIFRLPPGSHRSYFEKFMLKGIVRYLGNSLATQIIKRLFEYCQAENCMRCSADHQELMESTLYHATRRGNLELVKFLLPHATNKSVALSAAVRNGSRELIDLLLQNGASVSGWTHYLDSCGEDVNAAIANSEDRPHFFHHTTPLAEAIHSQNKDFVNKFEFLGALSHINQAKHFEAAIFAAAEVGDCHYIQKILELVPEKRGTYLTPALHVAICGDKIEAALILLGNGADANGTPGWTGPGPPLLEALRRQNKPVVEGIWEADVDVNPHRNCELQTPVVEAAGLWGNIPIVADLILMGADIDVGLQTTALAAAVKSRNRALVELLLKNGASPRKCAVSGVSPLEAAIANEDGDMTRLLFSSGADPANDKAFLSALENSQQAFSTLLETFSARYPQGKKSFGGDLLIKAVEKGDATLLNTMLIAKFDVNSFSRQDDMLLIALGFAIVYRKGRDLKLVQKLIDAGGDPNSIARKPYDYRRDDILCRYENLGGQDMALTVAIMTRGEQMVELLLTNGADLNRPARKGLKRTPLQQACEIGSFKIVKLLLENGAGVNERPADRGGAIALQLAAISGSIKIANLLLTRGALVHASPAKVDGRLAFEGAAEQGCLEMIRVLWDAVSGLGFTPEQIENAICLANGRGHRGCAEYIASLSSVAGFPLL
ncbi:uncharacterized protein PAC_19846 [Phialocephala subalpina]|uniref:Clr5 domain-containing protein n=1 Tax=Phialocephala subalpina TaxID=576137 RepID=A0A1L7XYD4_9HELO|nr:uncharacterized protein PAC_19846 [Phialocephala subalpina]